MTISWGRRILAALMTGFLTALVVHLAVIVLTNEAFLLQGASWEYAAAFSGWFTIPSLIAFVLLAVAGLLEVYTSWWITLIVAVVVGVLATSLGTMIYIATLGQKPTLAIIWGQLGGRNLIFVALLAVLVPTVSRWLFGLFARLDTSAASGKRVALVRIPAKAMSSVPVVAGTAGAVDGPRADEQWDAYVAALAAAGFKTVEVSSAEQFPESTFVQDMAVILDDIAVIARTGDERRRAEAQGAEAVLTDLGLHIERIQEPGTLDGGDVLVVGSTVYVGRSAHTNAEGVRQLRALATEEGFTVIAVPVTDARLTAVATALPDGTVVGDPARIADTGVFERFLAVSDGGVVPLGADTVLVAGSSAQTAAAIRDLGYRVVSVDLSEFEKVGGAVSRLSLIVG